MVSSAANTTAQLSQPPDHSAASSVQGAAARGPNLGATVPVMGILTPPDGLDHEVQPDSLAEFIDNNLAALSGFQVRLDVVLHIF